MCTCDPFAALDARVESLDGRYTGRGPEIHQIHCVSALRPDTLDTQVICNCPFTSQIH